MYCVPNSSFPLQAKHYWQAVEQLLATLVHYNLVKNTLETYLMLKAPLENFWIVVFLNF